MVIRDLASADVAALRAIDAACFGADDQYEEPYYYDVIEASRFEALGLIHDGGIRAWALIDLKTDPIRIRSLAVHPQYRRRGFGLALIEAVINKHATAIDLLVDPHNVGAIALYEKMGFQNAEPDPEMPERLRMVRAAL